MSTPQTLTCASLGRIFKRDDIRGVWPDELNSQVAERVGAIFVSMVMTGEKRAIVLGHDARTGSFELLNALADGIRRAGGTVESLGLCSSEQVYYMAGAHAETFAGGAMVTASHNPAEYNGIKFVHSGAEPFGHDDLAELQRRLMAEWDEIPRNDIGDEFADYVFALAGMDGVPAVEGEPLRIVVAGGNGVGAVAFRPLAERLRSKGVDCQFIDEEPDGNFPNGVPNPLLPAFEKRLGDAVLESGADLGVGFDGDADRAGFVDETGRLITPSHVLALVAKDKMASVPAGKLEGVPVIVCNLCCSQLLSDLFGGRADVELVRTPVGHGQNKRVMRHDAYNRRVVFGGEHSGHYFYPEFYCLDSGMLTSLYMLRRLMALRRVGRTLAQALEVWRRRYLWSGELNYRMPDADSVNEVLAAFRTWGGGAERFALAADAATGLPLLVPATADGPEAFPDVKLEKRNPDGSGWWLVLRPSGNEPVLRLNAEVFGLTMAELQRLVMQADDIVRQHGGQAIK